VSYYLRVFCTGAESEFRVATPERLPVRIEISRRDDDDDLFGEELAEFQELVADSPPSEARERVLDHLRRTLAIVALELKPAALDEAGHAAAEAIAQDVATACRGIVHADGEGFYEGTTLVLETR
jgi:hypothetical protein